MIETKGTKENVTAQFKQALQELLDVWGAELEARDHYDGYPECGEDIRMTVTIPAVYTADGDTEREWTEIDLGSSLQPNICREP